MEEKRQSKRYDAEILVELTADGRVLKGKTQNLSSGGLCALLPKAVPKGKIVEVQLSLILGELLSESLWIQSRIVWCTKVGNFFQIGISFQTIPKEKQYLLQTFLHHLSMAGEF